jgi:hypothetical protein
MEIPRFFAQQLSSISFGGSNPAKNRFAISLWALSLVALADSVLAFSVSRSSQWAAGLTYSVSICLALFTLVTIWYSLYTFFAVAKNPEKEKMRIRKLLELFSFKVRTPPSRGYHRFLDVVDTLRECPPSSVAQDELKSFDSLRKDIIDKSLVIRSENYKLRLAGVVGEIPALVRSYKLVKARSFLVSLMSTAAAMILAFTTLDLSTQALSSNTGFKFCEKKRADFSSRLPEALYFSSVTAATVGYGDIAPTDSMWAQMVITVEVATVFVFIVFGVSFAIVLVQFCEVDNSDIAEFMQEELRTYAGEDP